MSPPDRCRQLKDHRQKETHEDEGAHTYIYSAYVASPAPPPISTGNSYHCEFGVFVDSYYCTVASNYEKKNLFSVCSWDVGANFQSLFCD